MYLNQILETFQMDFTAVFLLRNGRDSNVEQGRYVLAFLQGVVWT